MRMCTTFLCSSFVVIICESLNDVASKELAHHTLQYAILSKHHDGEGLLYLHNCFHVTPMRLNLQAIFGPMSMDHGP